MAMKLLLYFKETNSTTKHLQRVVEKLVPPKGVTSYHSFKTLSERLHQPKNGLNILVLVAGDVLDLSNFITLKNTLSEFRIILVLPDHDEKTLAMGHKIFPRFVSFTDSNFSDVTLVIKNLLKKQHNNI